MNSLKEEKEEIFEGIVSIKIEAKIKSVSEILPKHIPQIKENLKKALIPKINELYGVSESNIKYIKIIL